MSEGVIEPVLTAAEAVELEGLRARNKKGKVEPGSVEQGRMMFLLRMEETGVREVEEVRRWSCAETCAFYGLKERWWRGIRTLGEESGTEVPWEDPEKFLEWFTAMQGRGLRKHGPPPEVVAKASAARLGRMMGRGEAVPAAPPVVTVPRPEGEDRGAQAVLVALRREVDSLQQHHDALISKGELLLASSTSAELSKKREELRKWEMNAPKMRAGDAEHEAALSRTMQRAAGALWNALQKALHRSFPESDRDRLEAAINETAALFPALMAEELGLAPPSAAA